MYIFELLIRKESKHMPMQKKNSSRKIKDYRKPTIFFYRRAFFFYEEDFFFIFREFQDYGRILDDFIHRTRIEYYIARTFVSYLKEFFLHAYVNVDELQALIIYERITVYRRIC